MALEQGETHTKGVKKPSPRNYEPDEAEAKLLNMSFCAARSPLISSPTSADLF